METVTANTTTITTTSTETSNETNNHIENHLTLDMSYWQQRCSICFDQPLDFCLEKCRDQYCRQCFSRYVDELVKNHGWGLSLIEIKCPVCQDLLSETEWKRYCFHEVLEKYEKFNQPFKTLIRHCPSCQFPVSITEHKQSDQIGDTLFMIRKKIEAKLLAEDLTEFEEIEKGLLNESESHFVFPPVHVLISRLHQSVLKLTTQRPSSPKRRRMTLTESYETLRQASCLVISISQQEEQWRTLQFEHLKSFPTRPCSKCQSLFCFQCGLGAHLGLSCIDWMRHLLYSGGDNVHNNKDLESENDDEEEQNTESDSGQTEKENQAPKELKKEMTKEENEWLANLKWKVVNSKSCPQCHTLINREEGCNKVDCLVCSFRFCWICMEKWSEKCGFYKCRKDPLLMEEKSEKPESKSGPELGVPDVDSIYKRLSNAR